MTPDEILNSIYQRAAVSDVSVISDQTVRDKVDYICRCMSNRAGVRLLMSCLLAKLDKPDSVDPRKPYTEIGSADSFSGRTYDERYLTKFIYLQSQARNSISIGSGTRKSGHEDRALARE